MKMHESMQNKFSKAMPGGHAPRPCPNWTGRIGLIIASLVLATQLSYSEEVINIQGHFNENRRGKILNVTFSITLTKNACEILATNINDANSWERIAYDGTNTYVLSTARGHILESKWGTVKSCGLVNPGRQYYMLNNSVVHSYYPWTTFCLSPHDIRPDMPSVTVLWRASINDYGWRWKNIITSPDGRFLQEFSIVRDTSLDLDEKSEFLRPTYEYPRTIDDFEDEMRELTDRKSTPDGWVARTYVCKQWYETNGLTIPTKAEFTANVFSGGKTFLLSSAVIEADKISISEGDATIAAPPLAEEAYVRDYRYTRRNESRMFRYAEYTGSGAWKPDNDPELLAEANYQLNHGPKFGDYGLLARLSNPEEHRRLILIWSSLLLVNLVAIAMLVRNKLKQKTQP